MSIDPEGSKLRRASHRQNSPAMLRGASIAFETRNNGAHLVVRHADRVVDFWPGTGLWIERATGLRGRGVRPLIKSLSGKCVERSDTSELRAFAADADREMFGDDVEAYGLENLGCK